MKTKIIFVHGLGVKKDARGMFTDIESEFRKDEKLADFYFVYTDLNNIDEEGNLNLNPLSVQADIIKKVFEKEKEDALTIVIAHSQGCVVSALADLGFADKIILLCPPTNNDLERTINNFTKRPGTKIDLNGTSIIERSDGSKTFVPKEYFDERKSLDYASLYEKFIGKNVVTIFAKQDELVANDSMEYFSKIGQVYMIDGNHNFDREGRKNLIEKLKEII